MVIAIRRTEMKVMIILFLITLALSVEGREYRFDVTRYFKKVRIHSKLYYLTDPMGINYKEYKELRKRNIFTTIAKTPGQRLYVILSHTGKLVRNKKIIQKALFTLRYSQLNDREIDALTSPLIQSNKRIDESLQRLNTSHSHYFTQMSHIVYLVNPKAQLNDDDGYLIQQDSLARFIRLFLKNPVKGFKRTLVEILVKSRELNNLVIKRLRKSKQQVLSYQEALNMEQLLIGLIYGSATNDLLYEYSDDSLKNLSLAKSQAVKILKKQRKKLSLRRLKKMNPITLIRRAKKLFHKVYEDEEVFQMLIESIEERQDNLIRTLGDYKKTAQRIAIIIPYYKANYNDYSIPERIKEGYGNTIFYDDFSDSLTRWKALGPTKATIIDKALSTHGNGWYYSGVTSKVLFNVYRGDLSLEVTVQIGEGKGSFGFGEKKIGSHGEKGVIPIIGFLFNQDTDGSGVIDFRINNEQVDTSSRIAVDLRKKHHFKILLYTKKGIAFYIDGKKVLDYPFDARIFGSESLVLSSMTDDYRWQDVLVHQSDE